MDEAIENMEKRFTNIRAAKNATPTLKINKLIMKQILLKII